MADDPLDLRLTALLGGPDPRPDPAFVARIERAVRADQAFAAVRARAWRRFRGEAAASAAVAGAFSLLWRIVPSDYGVATMATPSMIAALMLGLWFLVELRPAGNGG